MTREARLNLIRKLADRRGMATMLSLGLTHGMFDVSREEVEQEARILTHGQVSDSILDEELQGWEDIVPHAARTERGVLAGCEESADGEIPA